MFDKASNVMILSKKKLQNLTKLWISDFWARERENVKCNCKTVELGEVIVFILYIYSFQILKSKLVSDFKIRRTVLERKK